MTTPKRTFQLEEIDALFDIYVDGAKVRNAHNCRKGMVAFHAAEGVDFDVEMRPHDPRIGIEAIFSKDGKTLEPHVDAEALARQAEENARKEAEKAKAVAMEEARKKLDALKKEREFKAASKLDGSDGGVLPKPVAPE